MVIEADMAGNYVGSSTVGRDWSKFSCCTCTNWNGADSRELGEICPTATSEGAYGAQFWLNAGGKFPDAPGICYCSGFQGQMVAIIPSLDLVIVRMGLKEDPDFFNGFLKGVIGSLKKRF
jgi:CubicO group peptidase (beta-lactamase class C family)